MTEVLPLGLGRQRGAILERGVYDGPGSPQLTSALPLPNHSNAEAWITYVTSCVIATTDSQRASCSNTFPAFDQEPRDFYIAGRLCITQRGDPLKILGRRDGVSTSGGVKVSHAADGEGEYPEENYAGSEITGERSECDRSGRNSEIRACAFAFPNLPPSPRTARPFHGSNAEGATVATATRKCFSPSEGAGWGHGVGLCQIEPRLMSEQGRSHQELT
jgi:hypothetical protein